MTIQNNTGQVLTLDSGHTGRADIGHWGAQPPTTLASGACAELTGYSDSPIGDFYLTATYRLPDGTYIPFSVDSGSDNYNRLVFTASGMSGVSTDGMSGQQDFDWVIDNPTHSGTMHVIHARGAGRALLTRRRDGGAGSGGSESWLDCPGGDPLPAVLSRRLSAAGGSLGPARLPLPEQPERSHPPGRRVDLRDRPAVQPLQLRRRRAGADQTVAVEQTRLRLPEAWNEQYTFGRSSAFLQYWAPYDPRTNGIWPARTVQPSSTTQSTASVPDPSPSWICYASRSGSRRRRPT